MKCAATTAAGRPCKRPALAGEERCGIHLGRTHRPTSLTLEIQAEIEALFRAGNYTVTVCAAAGVPRSTFNDWMKRGERDGGGPYREFRAAIDRARAVGEARNVAQIAQAAAKDWKAAAWLLERSSPDRWGRPANRKDDDTPIVPARPDGSGDADRHQAAAPLDELAARRTA